MQVHDGMLPSRSQSDHMPLPVVYEGPAVAVLFIYFTPSTVLCWSYYGNMVSAVIMNNILLCLPGMY